MVANASVIVKSLRHAPDVQRRNTAERSRRQ
jgi:hypothetical protein